LLINPKKKTRRKIKKDIILENEKRSECLISVKKKREKRR
jgi:hypothetical protein